MKTTFTAVIFLCLSLCTFLSAQDKKAALIFDDLEAYESTTIRVDISSYHFNAVGTLKDKLLAYPEKVVDIKFDNKQSEMILTLMEECSKRIWYALFRSQALLIAKKAQALFRPTNRNNPIKYLNLKAISNVIRLTWLTLYLLFKLIITSY